MDNDGALDLVISKADNQTKAFISNATTADLEILEVIPIQVVRGVDMILGKTGLVRVNVKNKGPLDANGTVKVTFEGNLLFDWDADNSTNITKLINANQNASFDFRFKPTQTGNKNFSTEVVVS